MSRTHIIQVYLNDFEYKKLEQAIKIAGTKHSTFCRTALLNYLINFERIFKQNQTNSEEKSE